MPDPSPEQHARALIARLELMSHVNAVNLDSNGGRSSDDEPGGKRPTGGIDTRDDLTQDSTLKSHVYYRRRLQRCHTTGQLEHLARDIQDTIDAWQKTPEVAGGLEPERGSFRWKRMIANDDTTSIDELKRRHMISVRTIYRYRAKYRTKRLAA